MMLANFGGGSLCTSFPFNSADLAELEKLSRNSQ